MLARARSAWTCWPPRRPRARGSTSWRRDLRHVPAERAGEEAPAETPATHRVYRPGRGDAFRVERTGPGAFRVEGERIERLIARHDVDNEEALRYVEERLRALGVIRALESAGFEPGDDVEIARDRLRARSRLIEVRVVRPPAALTHLPARAPCPAAAATTRRTSSRPCATSSRRSTTQDADTFCDELVTQEFLEQTTGANGDEDRPGILQARAQDAHRPQVELVRIGRPRSTATMPRSRAVLETQGRHQARRSASRRRTATGSWPAAAALTTVPDASWGQARIEHRRGRRGRGARRTCSRPVCDQVAERHRAGDDVVVVTSGAIARGMRLMELPMRPTAMEELQAASAVGQGKLYRALRRAASGSAACRRPRCCSRSSTCRRARTT